MSTKINSHWFQKSRDQPYNYEIDNPNHRIIKLKV